VADRDDGGGMTADRTAGLLDSATKNECPRNALHYTSCLTMIILSLARLQSSSGSVHLMIHVVFSNRR